MKTPMDPAGEVHRTRNWIPVWMMILAAGCCIAAFLVWPWQPFRHSQNFDRAVKIADASGWSRGSGSYQWVSNEEILHYPAPQLKGTIKRLNIRTGSDVPEHKAPKCPATMTPAPGLLPTGMLGLEVANSRVKGKLAYITAPEVKGPPYRFLYPIWRFTQKGRQQYVEFWVSNSDGSDLRRIGRQDVKAGEMYPGQIRWTPDGKQLSYLFRGGVYTFSPE